MACPRCGERCICAPVGDSAGIRLSVSDLIPSTRERQMGFASGLKQKGSIYKNDADARRGVGQAAVAEADPDSWRDEIASRVQAHRARRRRKFDPEASMSLGFEIPAEEPYTASSDVLSARDTSVAVDEIAEEEPPAGQSHTFDVLAEENAEPAYEPPATTANIYERMAAKAAEAKRYPLDRDAEDKIIEFPRSPTVQNLFAEELAEPISAPRILDVPEEPAQPEVVMSAPLATVSLEGPVGLPEWAESYEDDYDETFLLPLQVAPLGPRVLCGVMDGVLVLTASALFSLIVLSMAKFVPQGKAATAIAVLLPTFLWAVYHYVFLVFGGITPGMLMAQLELSNFEGCVPHRKTRITRVVAMMLSCASLGLGFAWAMLDEDNLGWHDRITRTYLKQS